ncbi:MAG TPA: cytochrome c peroxidase [Polyangiaceae bacterium]|nr:cytochrome c peroxidase [Polyangiaceae bacterium]
MTDRVTGIVLAIGMVACAVGCGNTGDGVRADPLGSDSEALSGGNERCRNVDARQERVENLRPFKNESGHHATFSTRDGQVLDTQNAFFQSLGTNGRTCGSCHAPEDGFSVSATNVRKRFDRTCGLDPIFRPIDGATNPAADVSSLQKRRDAYSLLLEKGLIRIQEPIPPGAEFELLAVDDPYGNDLAAGLTVFRRPLAAMNLKFNAVIMWDGREPDLASQAKNATLRHAEATDAPDDETLRSIVDFETALFTTQVQADGLGSTSAAGATGDPRTLSTQDFFVNINRDTSTFPPAPTERALTTDVFTTFDAWASSKKAARASVARGQALFNRRQFFDPVGGPDTTCSECHNAPNAGSFSGPTEAIPPFGGMRTVLIADAPFRTPDLPLYTVGCSAAGVAAKHCNLGDTRQTSDPGMAFRSGLWRDVSRFKAPHLRGVASRAPFFHNGMAATLADVVDHYDTIDHIGLTADEKADLTAFLGAL